MDYTALIDHYGYLVLFVALVLELIIFGIPTEILMGYAGFLVYQGKLNWILAVLAAGAGSCIGITISYFIGGKLGFPFFRKYGHKVHMGPDRLDKFHGWFSKYGNGLIIVAYFIPGIRHITGYFSGITKLDLRKFMPFAYFGAFLWVFAFISLGKALGPQWQTFHEQSKKYLIIGGLLLGIVILVFYLYKRLKGRFLESLKLVATRSPLKLRLSIIGTTLVFILLFAFLIGLTQDYLANESTKFNFITALIMHGIFQANAASTMKSFTFFSLQGTLISVSLLTVICILVFKHDKLIELIFFVVTIGGGIGVVKGLNSLANLISPSHPIAAGYRTSTFLSAPFLISLIIWGFFSYIIVQQSNKVILWSLGIGCFILISLLLGVSRTWFGIDPPSTTLTSFIFAGVWLTLCIALLDLFRELRRIQHS